MSTISNGESGLSVRTKINDVITKVDGISVRGIAKAWVNFNGTGTIAARDSENVSSLTDNGTGLYSVNFSNVFATANYSAHCHGVSGSSLNTTFQAPYNLSTGSVGANIKSSAGSAVDTAYVLESVLGDLA